MAITASMVKELREMTGAGMMDCKNALVETDGNIDQAVEYLKEKGLAKAYVDPLSVPTNAAYWANAEAAKGYDKYRQVSGRDIEDIPLVEVRNVVLLAISQQLSLSIDDLLSQISRLLGFPRRTSKTKEAIYRVIEHLEREGKVRCEGDNIFTTDSTIH